MASSCCKKFVCIKTSEHEGDFYCLNCFQSYTTENNLKMHEKRCEDHDYCYIEMPEKDNKILKYNHGEKSMKVPFIIFAELESLLEKMNTCYNNPEKLSKTKINKHIPSGYSLFTHCSTKNKLDYYRGKNRKEKLFSGLKRACKKNNQL